MTTSPLIAKFVAMRAHIQDADVDLRRQQSRDRHALWRLQNDLQRLSAYAPEVQQIARAKFRKQEAVYAGLTTRRLPPLTQRRMKTLFDMLPQPKALAANPPPTKPMRVLCATPVYALGRRLAVPAHVRFCCR
ncbi:hypothetical protein SPRG_15756 [Saprolegnia parasitica CBS 223.65]|uniref:Uncharacterized protein n=1 Tax=Saprolegnia parasitica (strain CBS 223.65) TaxID=695850 RepID=A0A067BWL3_SAPPC|nr:hypothetical protein SPRG_15756 [Saprolegnia parasitica CBS 223.65]KDO19007.1 hypothetical protein SPRG_15756 [Saprolegnia parasitica CBS 223.65]|eukprot:XP_012210294.1 hypothetical protein SPRG_15756 [Saprolegnia parasitica CBS 223.65]